MITKKLLTIVSSLFIMSGVAAQLSEPLPFMTKFSPVTAKIIDYKDKDKIKTPFALVRLPNDKVAYMSLQNGKMEPYYIKAIETGYWDTRYEKDTNYDSVFADMRDMGANTAYVMIHWEDIEPSDGKFDYSFTDSLVASAQRQNMKIGWVLFLHAQTGRVPSLKPETAWTFHLDDRDSVNYTMQWVDRKGVRYNKIKDILDYGVRPLHVYGHKEIFYRVRRMLYDLGIHYKNCPTVMGVQIGNEEGWSFLDNGDFNPVSAELFNQWKKITNKTDYAQFKKESMDWWWSQFASAYHEADPYKITWFNLDAAQPEAQDHQRIDITGTSAATYKDGNLDAIGTMFYGGFGHKAFIGLDKYYGDSYIYEKPLLVPSEIGIGRFNATVDFNQFIAKTIERAGQGFGVYCYGEVRKELTELKKVREELVQLLGAVNANESIIYAGLPGVGDVECFTDSTNVQFSHINDGNQTLALVYFPNAAGVADSVLNAENEFDIPIYVKANKDGDYDVNLYNKGKHISVKMSIKKGEVKTIVANGVKREDLIFVNVKRK